MSRKHSHTRDQDQESRRIEGLRLLARIIARHYLAHPELYPDPGTDRVVPAVNGAMPAGGSIAHGEGNA